MGRRQRRRNRAALPLPSLDQSDWEAVARVLSNDRYLYEVVPDPELPEHDRSVAVSELAKLGTHRLRLLVELQALDRKLSPYVQQAITAGVPYRRIQELTGYSRSAISRWSAAQAGSGSTASIGEDANDVEYQG